MSKWLTRVLLAILVPASLIGCASQRVTQDDQPSKARVLLVLTNTDTLGETDKPTGFFLSEAAHPWAVFTQAGYAVTLTSPKGGDAPIDPRSLKTIDDHGQAFLSAYATEKDGRTLVENTRPLGEIELSKYDAVFYAGGHGTMWDFEAEPIVAQVASRLYEQGGVVAAVCHGPAALVNARQGGTWLLEGKRVTGFTNAEEDAVELTDEMPFLLETRMTDRGAAFVAGENFKTNVITDGRLVTGQNPASAKGTAEQVVIAIERSR